MDKRDAIKWSIFMIIALLVARSAIKNVVEEKIPNSSTKDIVENNTITESQNEDLFENPTKLCEVLSNNGIGKLKEWQNPFDIGWGSITDYYLFDPPKNGVGLRNNLAYYIDGTPTTVTRVQLNLKINNVQYRQNALLFLSEITTKTFKSLNISLPKGLIKAVLNAKPYSSKMGNYLISNKLEEGRLESWTVEIEKK